MSSYLDLRDVVEVIDAESADFGKQGTINWWNYSVNHDETKLVFGVQFDGDDGTIYTFKKDQLILIQQHHKKQ